MPALHPVKKNYRKVHVTILYWEADELQVLVRPGMNDCVILLIHAKQVQRISDVFQCLYHYEVREIPLPHRQKVQLGWPWVDDSIVDERDLQIMYYLGSTMTLPIHGADFLDFAASPAKRIP